MMNFFLGENLVDPAKDKYSSRLNFGGMGALRLIHRVEITGLVLERLVGN